MPLPRHWTPDQEKLLDNRKDLDNKEVAEMFEFYQQNPILAAGLFFDLPHGLPWHQRIALKMAWDKQDSLQVWTRGGGKTFFLSVFGSLSACCWLNEKVGIFSASFRQARFVCQEIERLYDKSPVFRELCAKKPLAPPDRWYLPLLNGSIIEALPLGDGGKIRGARYFRLLVDEFAQVPKEIFEIVIQGMRATTKDPMANVNMIAMQKRLLEAGLISEEDLVRPPSNKILMTSTAYYRFNHLYDNVLMYEREIKSPTNRGKHPKILVDQGDEGCRIMSNDDRCLVMFDYHDPPEGFMDQSSIAEARRKMSEQKFKMEYCAYFPKDSEGFFKRSTIERSRNHELFTVELRGDPLANYVMGIDVARKSDNFAICIFRLLEGGRIGLVRVISCNNKSFNVMHDKIREVLEDYNIIHICMDTGGGGYAIEDMLHNPDLAKAQPLIWDSYNNKEYEGRAGLHILDMVKFSDDLIPKMAEQMLSFLDHRKLILPALPSRVYPKATLAELEPYEDAYAEIEEFMDETSSIVASATRTGKIHLGLPSELGSGANSKKEFEAGLKAERKDRWTAGMLGCWAFHRHFNQELLEEGEEPAYGFAL